MLNHAIDNLTTAQEDVFLTRGLIAYTRQFNERVCFLGALGVARDGHGYSFEAIYAFVGGERLIANRFNELCQKLHGIPVRRRRGQCGPRCDMGTAKLGELIRARIIENRARRALKKSPDAGGYCKRSGEPSLGETLVAVPQ